MVDLALEEDLLKQFFLKGIKIRYSHLVGLDFRVDGLNKVIECSQESDSSQRDMLKKFSERDFRDVFNGLFNAVVEHRTFFGRYVYDVVDENQFRRTIEVLQKAADHYRGQDLGEKFQGEIDRLRVGVARERPGFLGYFPERTD